MKDSVLDEGSSPDHSYSQFVLNNHNLQIILSFDVKTKHIYYHQGKKGYAGLLRCLEPKTSFPKETNEYFSKAKKAKVEGEPIFLIGFTPRCGSTLVQRMLCSIDNVMLWGEPQGAIAEIYHFHTKLMEINRKSSLQMANSQYQEYDYKGFISNLSPTPRYVDAKKHLSSLLEWHFDAKSYASWGFKVINWSPRMVSRLHSLFPDASFIFLHRNFKDVEKSINRRKNWWPNASIELWRHNYDLMHDYVKALPIDMNALIIDFDQYKENIEGLCVALEKQLQFEERAIDRSFINDRVSDPDDANYFYGIPQG